MWAPGLRCVFAIGTLPLVSDWMVVDTATNGP